VSLLRVQELCKAFGGVLAARAVGFSVDEGEMVALIGPNGAGKSTVFNMIGGQLQPDRGTVLLHERTITRVSPGKRFRLGIGRTFQVAQTFLSMTVAENVQMALISRRRQNFGLWTPARRSHRDEALALLAQVGMAEAAERPCSTLAYGDVKRVELAIALAGRPKLLLMDEPTAGMAPKERVELMALTARLVRERGTSVLFTEHDMDVVFAHADRVIVLNRGRIIAEGAPAEVRRDAQVQDVYLGTGAVFA
jgi:branched-chain amino acid transport system ATP-binding protein